MIPFEFKNYTLLFLSFVIALSADGQFLMDMVDTSSKVQVSGYIQPQFQVATGKGIETYSGGDFSKYSDNRIMLRRGRIRFDYSRKLENEKPSLQFVLQVDATERGVSVRDLWGRILENKWQIFDFTAGMFARPFGYEINLSSSDRESPERGRMSQILMRTERDLGMMVTAEPKDSAHPLRFFKLDAGFFNGQGLISLTDYDSHKDFIGRVAMKPYKINKLAISAGLSYFNGGLLQNSRYINQVKKTNGLREYVIDSNANNLGGKAPRRYKGADIQFKLNRAKGFTSLRAEYWKGIQTAVASSSETPPELPEQAYYIRDFDGGFFYFLHRFLKKHELIAKYDWYDPNIRVAGNHLQTSKGFTPADIKYTTLGFGYIYYMNNNLKITAWYDIVKNESTGLSDYMTDLSDNVFTCRFQFRF